MKFIIGLLLLSCIDCYSQDIPKDAETIMIKHVTFLQACNRLLDSGYVIEKKDNDLQTASTKIQLYPRYWNLTYSIDIRVKDSTLYMKAMIQDIFSKNTFFPASYKIDKKGRPMNKSNYNVPFLELYKIAASFNLPLEYVIAKP